MILVRDIRLPLSAGEPQAFEKALHLARIPRSKAAHLGVARLSVDARHGQPKLVYTIAVTLKDEGEESAYAGASPCVAIRGKTDLSVQNGTQRLPHRPVVCGLGPAGLFAALLLARHMILVVCMLITLCPSDVSARTSKAAVKSVTVTNLVTNKLVLKKGTKFRVKPRVVVTGKISKKVTSKDVCAVHRIY